MAQVRELNSEFAEALQAYQGEAGRALAAASLMRYVEEVRQFLLFLQGQGMGRLAHVSAVHLRAYIHIHEQQGMAVATKRRKIFAVKSFCAWLKATRRLTTDPAATVIPPERAEKAPRVLTKEEQERLLASVTQIRDRAIMLLFLKTGIALSEIEHLRVPDLLDLTISTHITAIFETTQTIRKARGTLHVPGSRERTVPLDGEVCEALSTWLEERPHAAIDALFLSTRCQPLSRDSYHYLVEHYLKGANIQGASVQTLRHTFTVERLKTGDSPEKVKQLLGIQTLHLATFGYL